VGNQGHFLEYIILPLSLIVLFVEAILEAVLHRLLSSIPSKAYLWLVALKSSLPVFSQV